MSGTTRSCNTDTVSSSLSRSRPLALPLCFASPSPSSALQSRQSAAFFVDSFTASVPCAPCDSHVFFRFRNVCILSPGWPDFVTTVDPSSSYSSARLDVRSDVRSLPPCCWSWELAISGKSERTVCTRPRGGGDLLFQRSEGFSVCRIGGVLALLALRGRWQWSWGGGAEAGD